jgi:hypothetical protein
VRTHQHYALKPLQALPARQIQQVARGTSISLGVELPDGLNSSHPPHIAKSSPHQAVLDLADADVGSGDGQQQVESGLLRLQPLQHGPCNDSAEGEADEVDVAIGACECQVGKELSCCSFSQDADGGLAGLVCAEPLNGVEVTASQQHDQMRFYL